MCPAEAAKSEETGSSGKPSSHPSAPQPSLLVLSATQPLSGDQIEAMYKTLQPICQQLGMQALITERGMSVDVHRDLSPLIAAIQGQTEAIAALAEQTAKAIEQNATFLQAMAEQDGGEDGPLTHYLSGEPATL